MSNAFVPVEKAEEFAHLADNVRKANGALLAAISKDLSPRAYAEIFQVITHGGRIGLELLMDIAKEPIFNLVAVEREGMRRVIAEWAPISKNVGDIH